MDGPGEPAPGQTLEFPVEGPGGGGGRIGRSAACLYCLADPGVSREHARISRRGDVWYLTDSSSKDGTYLNGARLEAEVPAPIAEGDEIAIGPWRFRAGDRREIGGRTIALTSETAGMARVHSPSRRLMALSACIERLAHARGEQELARAALEWAILGSGYRRGAVLRPPAGGSAGDRAPLVLALSRERGEFHEQSEDEVGVAMTLVRSAASGDTAVLDEPEDLGRFGESVVQRSIHSAVCCPVRLDGRVALLMYLDARAQESRVRDATGFCEDIAQVYALALSYSARVELERRQAELRAEMERARVLRSMLDPPAVVERHPIRVAHRMLAGQLVSGDLFHVHEAGDGSLVVVLGDAMGHGVGAAMITALTHAYLHAELSRDGVDADVSRAITRTNAFLAPHLAMGGFVTAWCGRVWPDGRVSYVDAGHGHWLVVRGGSREYLGRASSMPIGLDAGNAFDAHEIRLSAGDRLVLFTDGVGEHLARAREGARSVVELVSASATCEDDVARTIGALAARGGGIGVLEDDATIASIELSPPHD